MLNELEMESKTKYIVDLNWKDESNPLGQLYETWLWSWNVTRDSTYLTDIKTKILFYSFPLSSTLHKIFYVWPILEFMFISEASG